MKNLEIEVSFLGVFANLLKATINFVISDRLSVRPPGSKRTDFHKIWYLSIFRKYVEKIQI